MNESVRSYGRKFWIGFSLIIPILILVMIIPYTNRDFIISNKARNGTPLYVYLVFAFSTIIQFCMGYSFYISGYKSLKHKSANMDVLIAMGTTAAWTYGFALMIVGYDNTMQ